MIIEFRDKYNENKTWVIKRTSCRHYYINQKINGKMFYSKFQRVSKALISDVVGFDIMADCKYMIDYEVPTALNSKAIHRYIGTIGQVDKVANKCDEIGYKIVNVQAIV